MMDCYTSDNKNEDKNCDKDTGKKVRMSIRNPLRGKIVKVLWMFLGLGMIYLTIVFISASNYSTNYLRMEPKPGYSRPEVSNECRQILAEADLQPYGDKHPIEFREYGNVWLGDGAKTLMYKSSVLKHPQCFDVLIKRLVSTKMHYILVIYDCENKSEVLIIRNYNK
ncbi:MAG: hypothetical protein WCW53_12730 [Syntrophales bacterium]|jgi:hypothetical protein